MAFLRQLQLLLWKNGLSVIRQPIWSLTLIAWPLIIFIILAVTRVNFPPVVKETCYTGSRNLPSAGFFPFLQTLMCNTDTTCNNKSRLTHTSSSQRSSARARSSFWPQTFVPIAVDLEDSLNAIKSENSSRDIEIVKQIFISLLDPTHHANFNNMPFMSENNTTALGGQESFNDSLQSMNVIKRTMCTVAQPVMNLSSVSPLTEALVTFCKSNDTVFEAYLITLNQVLTKLMLTKPDEVLTGAGTTIVAFNQLQNQSSLWESLLVIPQLFSPTSLDQALSNAETLLTNVQGSLHVLQSEIPEARALIPLAHSLLAIPINLIHYAQKWPGKDVSISLGDVVTFESDSTTGAMNTALQNFKIPLDKALFLLLDRDMLHSYICGSDTDSMWITLACSTGTADMFLRSLSRDKVAKQVLLVWSKNVASHDLTAFKGLLQRLMGVSSHGGDRKTNTARTRRSVETQPQNIDEELFLSVGQVVMDIIAIVPEVETVVQAILKTSFNSMKTASLALDTVNEILDNVLIDATQLQNTYFILLTNQSGARIWIDHVLDSVTEVIFKTLPSTRTLTCEDLLSPFEWLLPNNSVKIEVWRSLICQNVTALQQTLLMDWLPLIQTGKDINNTMTGDAKDKVTLPLILSEWHKLSNNTLEFGMFLDRLRNELGAGFQATPNCTFNVTEVLQQSVFSFMVKFGQSLEKSNLWSSIKNNVHMSYWILKYRPGTTNPPPNCSVDVRTFIIDCNGELDWSQFVRTAFQALALPNQDVLVNCLKGTATLLQHVYSGLYKHYAALFLHQQIRGGNALVEYLINLMDNLNGFVSKLIQLDDKSISNPNVMLPLINSLLQSTGLEPLLSLFNTDSPLNISSVLDAVIKIGRRNQHIFTFNETNPASPDLERLITQFLILEGNLSLSLSLSMVRTLFIYSDDFRNADMDLIRDVIQPFTNQTSAGIMDNILRVMEQLRKVMDSPNADPENIILLYINQLKDFLVSAYRLRRYDHILLPSGQLSTAQVTDHDPHVKDLFNLLTPEGLQNLSQAGPDTVQKIVMETLLRFLPADAQQNAAVFQQHFQSLQMGCKAVETNQKCLAEVSEFFKTFHQTLEILLTTEANITVKIPANNSSFGNHDQVTTMFFSLLLPPNAGASMTIFKQILSFIRVVTATPNVTLSHIQNALRQSNLTLWELQNIASYAGTDNINGLIENILAIANARQCFEPSVVTAQCVMQLINTVSGFLAHVPALCNETSILSFIPVLLNEVISDVVQTNFTSDANHAFIHALNSTLAKIKMNLRLINLNSPELMEGIRVLESLLILATKPHPFNANGSGTSMKNPFYELKAHLEIQEWYLKMLENVTRNRNASVPICPLYKLIEMQLALQLEQTDFILFVVNRTEHLFQSLQYPIDGAGVSKIGQTTTEILLHLFEFIKGNFLLQNNSVHGTKMWFNSTILHATEQQFKKYIDFVQQWMREPNVLNSVFQWGNSSVNGSTLGADLHQMLQTVGQFLSKEQLAYLSTVDNVTQCLSKALMAADHLSEIHNDNSSSAILTAVQNILKMLTMVKINDTNSTIPKLERLIMCFLGLQGNFTMSPSHSMGDAFLTYSNSFQPDAVACFNDTMHNLTNQSSAGILEAILRAMKQLKRVLDSPNRDPEILILAYIRQVQEFLVSACKLHKIEDLLLPSGQLSTDEVTGLHLLLKDFLSLLTPESLQNLTQAGPHAAQKMVAERIMNFLAENVQLNATTFLQDFQSLHHQMKDQNCSAAVSEFFKFLDYLLRTLKSEGNATITIPANMSSLRKCEGLATTFFSLLHPEDTTSVATFKQILIFVDMIMATPNVTVSQVQNALSKSNLTLEELKHIAGLAGAANINDLMENMKLVINANQCFESKNASVVTVQCLMGLINRLSGFLAHVPGLRNETTILSLIPLLVNETFSVVTHANFTRNPNQMITHSLSSTLAKIKKTLHLFHLNSSEIMNEIKMLDSLINFVFELDGGEVNMEIVARYLKKLENITSNSSVSHLLYPLYEFTERFVVYQLQSRDFSQFVSNQTEYLLELLRYPIDGTGISKFGQTTIEIIQHLFEFMKGSLEGWTNGVFDKDPLFNRTILNAAQHHFKNYTELMQKWMRKPNVMLVLNSMLQWNNSSGNASSAGTNLHNMLQIMGTFLSKDQLAYLRIIDSITQSLNKALMAADHLSEIHNDNSSSAILTAVQNILKMLTTVKINDTNSTIPKLQRLIMCFLGLEGNFTMSPSHSMGDAFLTYSNSFQPDAVVCFNDTMQNLTNQTSAGILEAILRAMKQLKRVLDSPNRDPEILILAYIRQVQEFLVSACKLHKIEDLLLPSGQLSTDEVTGLHLLLKDFLSLLTPESLQNLTQAGPHAAQKMVAERIMNFLAENVQLNATAFLQDFQSLHHQMKDQNCSAAVSEFFKFLDYLLRTLKSEGNATITIPANMSSLRKCEGLATTFFSLLHPEDTASVATFKQILIFVDMIMATPNVTVSQVQNALSKSNLTLEELKHIAGLAGAANINDLMENMKLVINANQCFESKNASVVTVQCLMGLINRLSGFLAHVPALRNETTILSLIPRLVNETFSVVTHANFTRNPNQMITHSLSSTLAKIKKTLYLFHLNSSEIMNEIKMLDSLINFVFELDGGEVNLEIVARYLKKLENITSNSSVSHLLYPLYEFTERFVVYQLQSRDFSQFVSNQTEYLLELLRYPIDGTGISKFGQTTIEIIQHLFEFMEGSVEGWTNGVFDKDPLFNRTILNAAQHHFKNYTELMQKWMRKPNVMLVLNSMLQWNNSSGNASSAGTNLHNMLQIMGTFLSKDQLDYLRIIDSITQSLNKAIMAADQPGGVQSDDFLGAILKAVKNAMQLQTTTTEPLPLSVQQNILGIVQESLELIVQPNISFASSRNISLLLLKRLESVIRQTVPKKFADCLISGIQMAATYFETISTAGGPDRWNEMILSQLKMVQSILPSNSTAQPYISVLINITHYILESEQGNMSLWASFTNASAENMHTMLTQMAVFLNTLWRIVKGEAASRVPIPSPEAFSDLDLVLKQLLTGQANQDTWDKLKKMLEALLSTLKDTDQWDNIKSVATRFEKVTRPVVGNMHAENALIQNLHPPVMALMTELTESLNSTRLNLTEVTERMSLAIALTVHAAQQANGTLECSETLKVWESVREAAGLRHASLAEWCNSSWKPLMEAYKNASAVDANLNVTHMGVGPMTVNATAAMIVNTVRALYQVNLNRSYVTVELTEDVCIQLSQLAGRPLSHAAQRHLYKQFQHMQLQSSLANIKMLSDMLLSVAPFLQGYTQAVEKALSHILNNYQLIHSNSSCERIIKEATMIYLTSANISSDYIFPVMWGNFSDLNETAFTNMMREALTQMLKMKILEKGSVTYQVLEQFVAASEQKHLVQKIAEMCTWWASTQASGLDLLIQALPKMQDILRSFLSVLAQLRVDMPANMELFEGVGGNMFTMVKEMMSNYGVLAPMDHQQQGMGGTSKTKGRHKREAPLQPMREPINDYIDLLFIDYSTLFGAMSVRPTQEEIMETVHIFFANPDLGVVVKGATTDMPWTLNTSKEMVIDAALGAGFFLTLPSVLQMVQSHEHWPPMDLLKNVVHMIPEDFPFSSQLKNITRALASESQENLILMQHIIQTATELLQTNLTGNFTEKFSQLTSQVCALEASDCIEQLMQAVSMNSSQLCHTILPNIQILVESFQRNMTELSDAIFQIFIGEPSTYHFQANWTSVISQSFGFNISSLSTFKINITSHGVVTVGEMLRNKTAFLLDVQKHMDFDPNTLNLLMESILPNRNLDILSWLVKLRHCDSAASLNLTETEMVIFRTLCSWSPRQWYSFSLLIIRHLNMEKLIYRMVLSEEMQILVEVLIQFVELLTNMMNQLLPAVSQLENYLLSFVDLSLMSNSESHRMARSLKDGGSSKTSFLALSQALCSKGMLAVFGLSKVSFASESKPSSADNQQREEMIERFNIPRNASPFCMNIFLDMVNTTEGAIAWAFFKPMLMGQILYTPDTPVTRAIMEKANSTLQEFANLKKYSESWIESSNYIVNSAEILSSTLPILQNSLGNSFVKNFIEMQTNIDVDGMKDTLSKFSNMTVLLEKNKHLLKQVTTLSNLMVNLSSCIKFDRYSGYDSADQLNAVAEELVKNRNLFASVIFKLPKDKGTTNPAQPFNSTSALPPRVSYTIRMHLENVMRTDHVREPFFMKDSQVSPWKTMRYNRGFVYVQENIDRAIIETQTGEKVTEPAVQLQPFPYPCHQRDEFLEATSSVFPLILMLAWILFVADFVKKLVYERELRLHEYMKMMGVNPLSHFFAWFLECATYLVFTIFILTLVLKYGHILPHSDGFLLFLYLCDYGLSVLAFSYLVSSFFDKTYIAGLSGSLLYVLCFFPFIVVLGLESSLSFSQKSALGLFSPTCFGYASQYVSRYEAQGQGIQWSNSYISPLAGDTASFGWLCWLMLIDSILYFIIGVYIRLVFPGAYGIAAPWYFPFKASFWAELCCCIKSSKMGRGLFFSNIMQKNQYSFGDHKEKGQKTFSSNASDDFSELPVGVSFYGLTKTYGHRVAIENLNVAFYEGHVTSLLGHNGAGKTTTMSLLTGLFAPSSGTIEVYGRDMHADIDVVRKELGVCMQYDVLFDHMTTKEHLLLYGQIKAPHWSRRELHEEVRKILEETGMYAHRHKRVGTLSGGMKRKLSISIAFIGGSRLVVLDEPTTGVDPCSRRSIWDIVVQHKKNRTIIMSTHHLDEAEVLSDRIAFLERGGLKCCGSPFHLKDMLGQGYKLTLTKKMQTLETEETIENAELKDFIQVHLPEARLKEIQGNDLVYSLPPFGSSSASSYRSLLTALDANLDALQLGCYGISDTTLEEVFLHLTHGTAEADGDDGRLSISETLSDSGSIDSFPEDCSGGFSSFSDKINLTSSSTVQGMALAWQQMTAILIKRFHHSRRDWKGLISQILLPVLFVMFAMGLGSIKSDMQHYPELELSPELYKVGSSYAFFSNQNPNTQQLVDTMMSFPGIDNACLNNPDNPVCTRSDKWRSRGNSSKDFRACKCTTQEQICDKDNFHPPHKKIPSSQIVYNLTGIDVEKYLVATANDFIRNRYGGFVFGMPLPPDLQMDLKEVPKNRTLSKVWFNPEGHHTIPAYINSFNNLILRSSLPADKDPRKYGISVSSHPYFGKMSNEASVVQGMLQILVAVCVLIGYSITTASFAIYEVHEHHSGAKRLQHIAGISEPFYWAVNFFYDMVMYLIPVALTVAVIAAFQIPAFTARQNLAAVALLLVLFGFASFPWMYLLSGAFKDPEMTFISYVCINLFLSVNTIISISILYFMSQTSTNVMGILHNLSHVFLIFPQFNFGNGLMELARDNIQVQILSNYGIDAYKSPFSTDVLGWMFISSFLEGLFFFTLRLLLNKCLISRVRHLLWSRKAAHHVDLEDEDEDVVAEHHRVSSGAAGSDILQVNQLTKVYQHLNRKFQAVKKISVGIPAGECFGLLGVNGAGKTTTFKMLTGDVQPTDGTAQIKDWDGQLIDIVDCRNKGINIGYCPQVDALDDLLTGEEHLYFYARIHGISQRSIHGVVAYLLKKLELKYHRNIVTKGYSCGTRRKLSTALALIGHPQILLLDEPSSGMDPRTKRHLWKIISEEVKGKCAVVLTSHSMEECEALCSRLAIMVKGQFRCLGSLQHIKNRFGNGFTVKMYLARACDTDAITSFMQSHFPSTYLKDQHSTMMEYHIPVAPGGVADIFDRLESNKSALQIKHFSVSQTTLDEVFINFAVGKIGMETTAIHSEGESGTLSTTKARET